MTRMLLSSEHTLQEIEQAGSISAVRCAVSFDIPGVPVYSGAVQNNNDRGCHLSVLQVIAQHVLCMAPAFCDCRYARLKCHQCAGLYQGKA